MGEVESIGPVYKRVSLAPSKRREGNQGKTGVNEVGTSSLRSTPCLSLSSCYIRGETKR